MSLLSDVKTVEVFINESTTKELVIVSHHYAFHYFPPVLINDQPVEAVEEFKCLGTFFDWVWQPTEYIFKKSNAALVSNHEIGPYNVSRNILEAVYRSLVESVLTFSMWFDLLWCVFKQQ